MYLNLVQIAESFGVTEKVVEGWIRNDGLPHIPDRRVFLFDRAQVAQWAATRGLAAKAGFLAAEAPTAALQLEPLLRQGGIWRDVAPADVPGTFVKVIERLPGINPALRQLLGSRLSARGGITYAPVGHGFALPHPSTRVTLGRDAGCLALLYLSSGLALDEPQVDAMPVTRLLFFIAPSPRAHLDMVGRLSRLLSRPSWRETLLAGVGDDELYDVVRAADAQLSEARAKSGGQGA